MFFDYIIASQRVSCSTLHVRIPEGLFVHDKVYYISYNAGVQAETKFTPIDFYNRVEGIADPNCAVYLRIPQS
jgi:hypothetical protein